MDTLASLPRAQGGLSSVHEKNLHMAASGSAGVWRDWLQVLVRQPRLYSRQRLGAERLTAADR